MKIKMQLIIDDKPIATKAVPTFNESWSDESRLDMAITLLCNFFQEKETRDSIIKYYLEQNPDPTPESPEPKELP
jgi:hypothetical protein